MMCIVNLERFPATVKMVTDTVVLSVSNTVKTWTEFESFANVSYCFGYSGIRVNVSDGLDIYWTVYNTTAIQASLSLMTFARYSYIFLWNETVPVTYFFS